MKTVIQRRLMKFHSVSKKQVITFGTILFFTMGSSVFISCGNSEEHSHDTEIHEGHEDHEQHAEYQCPMDCENGKKYDKPGTCPVCEMDLKEVEDE